MSNELFIMLGLTFMPLGLYFAVELALAILKGILQ